MSQPGPPLTGRAARTGANTSHMSQPQPLHTEASSWRGKHASSIRVLPYTSCVSHMIPDIELQSPTTVRFIMAKHVSNAYNPSPSSNMCLQQVRQQNVPQGGT